MSSTDLSTSRHSSVAEFTLLAHDQSHDVAQVAPDYIILERAADIPPGPAVLVIRLDGEELRRQIALVDGANGGSTRVQISRV